MAYFRSDKVDIFLDAPYCEIYVPLWYLDGNANSFADDRGSVIHMIGVADVFFFNEKHQVTDKKILNIPTWIDVNVYESRVETCELPSRVEKCKVLCFYKNQKVMRSTVIEDSSNAEKFLSFITKGKLPEIPYDDSIKIWWNNLVLNHSDLGVPLVIMEVILSVLYRAKGDPSKRFAEVIGQNNTNVSEYDYDMNSIREVCRQISTFTGLTFEDLDSMVTTSLNRTKSGSPEISSPVEALIKL